MFLPASSDGLPLSSILKNLNNSNIKVISYGPKLRQYLIRSGLLYSLDYKHGRYPTKTGLTLLGHRALFEARWKSDV